MNRSLLMVAAVSLSACGAPETGTIHPQLAFVIGPEVGLTAARDLTVDSAGSVYVFDYDYYVIHKFGPGGGALGTFG